MSIDIPLPADDGSVIVSDYDSEKNSWTFSTLSDPLNFDHPVSGNRKFGFRKNNDGSYTFFTQGIDRITQEIDSYVAENFIDDPFQSADALWQSLQKGIKNFVNNNGGNASINEPDKLRPDWKRLQRVFEGTADIESIGCK